MMEIGPWRVDGNGGFNTIEGGWEEYTTMVYSECYSSAGISASFMFAVVDQPAGTGFSYTSTDNYIHDLNDVRSVHPAYRLPLTPLQASDQFIEFLRNFYSVFPEYKTMDVRLLHLLTPPE